MKLDFQTYYDKVKGCYLGKNIGGTLGAPFECYRGIYDVDRFMQDVSSPVPNDDLDLQLVWLSAVEHEGRKIDSTVLAEYWNMFIAAVISEYGTGKNNFNMGILPPLSGYMRNPNRDSNGAWIRTEIWACLCPGNPALAANYAYYDACVDHANEGVYAAVFIAAIESAAFFEKDLHKLVEIGLSYIPEDCAVRGAVNLIFDCYKNGDTWQEARMKLFKAFPSSFGMLLGPWKGTDDVVACKECPAQELDSEIPEAVHGYDAPWSMGAIMIGWLYGEGDFGKSVCIANNCGEDTDCTAGALAAILGIILGEKGLPDKWKKGCSDKIATCTLRIDWYLDAPKSISDLCARIVKQTPIISNQKCSIMENGAYEITAADEFVYKKRKPFGLTFEEYRQEDFGGVIACGHDTVRKKYRAYTLLVKFDEDLALVKEGQAKKLTVSFLNQRFMPQYLTIRLLEVPEDWEFIGGTERCIGLEQWHGGYNDNGVEIQFIPRNLNKGKYTFILEIADNGKFDKNYLPITFINGEGLIRY